MNFFNLVRALFPRWNFFDEVGYRFHLEYKIEFQDHWTLVHLKSHRTKLSLFFNPVHNLALAQINVIEHFSQDVQIVKKSKIESIDTFKMIRSMVQAHMTVQKNYQFRVQARFHNSCIELYRSPILKIVS